MHQEPTADEAKELYAHFGLALYWSNVLEHGVANAIFILELLDGREGAKTQEDWEALVDRHFEASFAKTLGRLINQLTRHDARSPALADLVSELDKCVGERNFLAHHFWREYAAHWFTPKGRASMTHRLENARDLFVQTDKKLDAAIQPFADRHGLTADAERYELERIRQEASKGVLPND